MIRLIVLKNKPMGNTEYICDGSGCDKCPIRFKCFTNSLLLTVEVDWEQLKSGESPLRLLRRVTGSRIYVKGSKRYAKLYKEIKKVAVGYVNKGVVAQQAEVTG